MRSIFNCSQANETLSKQKKIVSDRFPIQSLMPSIDSVKWVCSWKQYVFFIVTHFFNDLYFANRLTVYILSSPDHCHSRVYCFWFLKYDNNIDIWICNHASWSIYSFFLFSSTKPLFVYSVQKLLTKLVSSFSVSIDIERNPTWSYL